jgi:group II intron reverse transcriptase/maturase
MESRPSRETVTPLAGRQGTGRRISKYDEASVMLSAQKCLEIARKRGEANQDINRVYRMLKCQELYALAYGKLSVNQGALTPGTDPGDTVDGMSMKRIDAIIHRLESGCYAWQPSRRIYIGKKRSRNKRPLGMPTWSDKLLQEVMRMILEAYYEPQFKESSHGFRPGRGCHTALREINRTWTGTKWFIETDIKGCFDTINHDMLLEVMSRNIRDARLLKLIRGMLEAGYMDHGRRYNTYSGTPQGGILSPLLANILLNELDVYVEQTLIPEFNTGEWKDRRRNPEYARLIEVKRTAKRQNQKWIWDEANRRMMELPSKIPDDPEFKRVR